MRKPKAKDPIPAIAAVAVMRSRLRPFEFSYEIDTGMGNSPTRHLVYSGLLLQNGLLGSLHTQVPPLSVKIDDFEVS